MLGARKRRAPARYGDHPAARPQNAPKQRRIPPRPVIPPVIPPVVQQEQQQGPLAPPIPPRQPDLQHGPPALPPAPALPPVIQPGQLGQVHQPVILPPVIQPGQLGQVHQPVIPPRQPNQQQGPVAPPEPVIPPVQPGLQPVMPEGNVFLPLGLADGGPRPIPSASAGLGEHVSQSLREKIVQGQYVELGELLSSNVNLQPGHDQRLFINNLGGLTMAKPPPQELEYN